MILRIATAMDRLRMPFLIASIWLVSVFVFTLPGRATTDGHIDLVSLGKLAVCMVIGAWSVLDILWYGRNRRAYVGWLMTPLMLFVAWSATTVLWSPIRTVSVGQLGFFASLLLFAAVISCNCRTHAQCSRLFDHMVVSLLCVNGFLLCVHLVRPDLSGFDRAVYPVGADGIVKPTAAGANASLGLIFGITGLLIWPSRFRVLAALPGLLIHGLILFFAANRTALALMVVMVPVCACAGMSRKHYASIGLAIVAAVAVLLAADPGFSAFGSIEEKVVDLAYRGETLEQIFTLNGRTEMWAAVVDEIYKSPWIGHGYFSSSEHGRFFMWGRTRNHTAHNIELQVIVSTGLVGAFLLAWGLIRPLRHCLFEPLTETSRKISLATGLVMLWYAGWTQLCISFVGPVRTESMVFFAFLGLAQANRLIDAEAINALEEETS